MDARTDLYSLGVTLFELLTGQPPFLDRDPLALVYAHLTRTAPAVDARCPEVPPGIAMLVAKLLTKEPERRYQTAGGVGSDLQAALTEWQAHGRVDSFALGNRDYWPRLRLPQLLLGREAETAAVAAAFARVAQGPVELMLVGGPSGIGKTALVRTVYRDIAQTGRGLLIAGKHDQLARSTPYAAMAQALGGLFRQWLASPSEVLQEWRERITSAVGDNVRLIADVAPELELVMGHKLPPVPPVQGDMILNRHKTTWLNFIGAVTRPSAPLVMFLDDLQWADSATLTMLETLLTDPVRRDLLVIAAYRDNEAPPEHPLWKLVEAVARSEAPVTRLGLEALTAAQVQTWLVHTLNSTPEKVAPLAEVLFHRTRGNPFFVEQLLLSLHQQKQVVRDLTSGAWTWNLAAIEQSQVTDNVVALLTAKVLRLAEVTQAVLGLAACAGHQFRLHELQWLSGWEQSRVVAALWPALLEELVVPVDGAYRPAHALGQEGEPALDAEYRFLHDRVQQACYERISIEQRMTAHLTIGRRLRERLHPQGRTRKDLLELVRHLNLGASGLTAAEQRELASLNLEAARAAKAASAYQLMASLLESGLSLLSELSIAALPEQATELLLERLEAAFLLREFADVKTRAAALLGRTLSPLQLLTVQEVEVRSCAISGEFAHGIDVGLAALAAAGLKLPDTEQGCLMAALPQVAELEAWLTANPDAIDRMPADPSPAHQLLDGLMVQMLVCAFQDQRVLLSVLLGTQGVLTILQRQAITAVAPLSMSTLSHVLASFTGMYAQAGRWTEVGTRAAQRVASPFVGECMALRGIFTAHSRPIDQVMPMLEEAIAAGLKLGSYQAIGWGLNAEIFTYRAWRGLPLEQVMARYQQSWGLVRRAGDALSQHIFELAASWSQALMDGDHPEALLLEESFARGSRSLVADGDALAAANARIVEAHVALATGSWTQALARAREAELYRAMEGGVPLVTDIPLWLALASAQCLATTTDPAERTKLHEAVDQGIARFQFFSQGCGENFLHKLHLLQAEHARLHGDAEAAMAHYDTAMALAQEQRFLHIEALAAQFSAEFHLQAGRPRIGKMYLRAARDAYTRWGARALVALLERKYPALLLDPATLPSPSAFTATTSSTTSTSGSASSSALDVQTVIRAAQALAGELAGDRVAAALMQLVQENAGAQRAALLLMTDEQPVVVALLDGATIAAGLTEPLAPTHPVAQSVVQFVLRSREAVILSDAPRDSRFAADPHLLTHGGRSVLAVPLLYQGRLVGLLYLEHDTTHAFPAARLALLGVLAAQGAIALENARLYAALQAVNVGLEAKVSERTAALNHALKELWAEMDLARKIQSVLLPPSQIFGERYEFAGECKPADQVGGDYYDALEVGGKLWVLIGDVSGHGISAGLITMMVQTAVRSLIESFASAGLALTPAQLLTLVNRAVWSNLQLIGKGQYMTMTALCIDAQHLLYAGLHQSLLVFRAATGQVEERESSGTWLGIIDEIDGINEDHQLELGPGDAVFLYTDGLVELRRAAKNNSFLELGPVIERFAEACRNHASSPEIVRRVLALAAADVPQDDFTVVALRHL